MLNEVDNIFMGGKKFKKKSFKIGNE